MRDHDYGWVESAHVVLHHIFTYGLRDAALSEEVRLKAFWGVFNQSLKRIALYEFSQKKEADKKAKELTASGKSPHFVQPVKEPVVVAE